MVKADSAVQTNNNQQQQGVQSTMCSSNVMQKLWERVSDNLTTKELEWFAGATEHAELVAFQLQSTIQGVGCLVSADGEEGSIKAGSFQDAGGVASLLFGISHAVADIRGLLHVGMSAQFRLNHPELYKGKSS